MSDVVAVLLLGVVACGFAFGCGYQLAEKRMCQSQTMNGKWIDGRCYDAATLREVRP